MTTNIISEASENTINAESYYFNDKYEKKQWYLDGSIQDSPLSIDVFPVWQDYTGAGIKVGVIDSQIDYTHTDLKAAYDTNLDYNFAQDTADVVIDPANLPYFHGTAVAGVIAAEAGNSTGTVGIAPGATLVGYGVDYSSDTVVSDILDAFAQAATLDVVNNSWSFNANLDDNFARNPEYEAALVTCVSEGRNGLGTSIVFAAGNAGTTGSSNYHNFQNSPYTIAVGAVDPNGNASSFTSVGANVLISAAGRDVYTTTLQGRYDYYNGTSFAAPAVSAAIALMLEANPELGYRDVQEILAYSARREGLSDTTYFGDGWQTNGAGNFNGGGLHFSDAYGYGFLNVHDAVRLAETWTQQQTYQNLAQVSKTVAADQQLIAGTQDTISVQIKVEEALSIEHVQLSMDLRWTETGNIDVYLISPEGTKVRLVYDLPDTDHVGNIRNFTFDSVASMGEMSAGTWTLVIENHDTTAVDKYGNPLTGSLGDVTLTILGNDTGLNDDVYIYTDEFGTLYAGTDLAERSVLHDNDAGNDTLNAAAITSNSTIDLSGKTATVLAGVKLTLDGQIENAFGGDGNDTIRGSVVSNAIDAGRGDDTIYFSFGNDTINGGAGSDTLVIDASLGSLTLGQGASGALDISVHSGEVSSIVNVETFILNDGTYSLADLVAAIGNHPAPETGQTDSSTPATEEAQTDDSAGSNTDASHETTSDPTGGDTDQSQDDTYANYFHGTAGKDKLTGTSDADWMEGGAGDDKLSGGNGNDWLAGDNGKDRLDGGNGNDTLNGGADQDKLYGGAGADTLYGGDGDDLIKGDDGDDWIVGGKGTDRLFGGAGADTFVFDLSDLDHIDAIYDFDVSEGDRILITGVDTSDLSGAQFTFTTQGSATLLQLVYNDEVYDIARIKGEGVDHLSMTESELGLLCA